MKFQWFLKFLIFFLIITYFYIFFKSIKSRIFNDRIKKETKQQLQTKNKETKKNIKANRKTKRIQKYRKIHKKKAVRNLNDIKG